MNCTSKRFEVIVLSCALGCTGVMEGARDGERDDEDPSAIGGRGGQSGGRPGVGGAGPLATGGSGGPPPPPSCAPDAVGGAVPLRRLTVVQYRNTVRDLVAWALADAASAEAVMKSLAPILDGIAPEERPKLGHDEHGTFRRVAQAVLQSYVDASYDVAVAAGAALTSPANLPKLLGSCATAGGDATTCIDGFLTRFGARARRAPLPDDERAYLLRLYGDTRTLRPAALADVVGALLASPQLLYFLEHGDAAMDGAPNVHRLSAYELASRLSYHFWDTMPDDRLWEAARSGALLSPEGYRVEVRRLARDARARPVLDRFYGEWMLLEEIPGLENLKADPAFRTFAGEDLPDAGLREAMIDDAIDLARHHTWTKPSSFDDFLMSPHAFPRNAALARLYGVPVWDGKGEPPRFGGESRPGYLTRAAFLATGQVTTRPIIRGVLVRTKLLCDEIPPPPANADAVTEEVSSELPEATTTRAKTAAITETSSPTCAACHEKLINHIGYVLEGFDALGRARTEEPIVRPNGTIAARLPVDTRAVPRIHEDDTRSASTPADLVDLMLESGKAHACFARHVVRFALGRAEEVDGDACAIGTVMRALEDGLPLGEALESVAFTPAFLARDFGTR